MSVAQFLREFVASPTSVGAIWPSSAALADRMCATAELPTAEMTIEFGPGTGVFTSEILRHLPDPSRFFAIESSANFVAATRRRCPTAKVWNDCATRAQKYLAEHGRQTCDRIISGLPFASFPPDLQDRLLDTILEILAPGGLFVTFAYLQGLALPSGRRFRHTLRSRFGHENVTTTPTVWRNIPPAFIYRARKTTAPRTSSIDRQAP